MVSGARVGFACCFVVAGCLTDVSYDKIDLGGFCAPPAPHDPAPPSCEQTAEECGPGRTEACCTASAVPCGAFLRDYDGELLDEAEGREATVSDFRLDHYEVTVGRFRAFLDAGEGTQESSPEPRTGAHPRYLNSGWSEVFLDELAVDRAALESAFEACAGAERRTWTAAPAENENKPINCVTWYEALLFCAWDGGRLPSELEWTYAAAGGAEQRSYPWGAELDADHAVFGCPDTMPGCPVGTALGPVGSKPAGVGRWGHFDLAGNVSEWVLDAVDNTYVTPCNDCLRIGAGERGLRGGAFNTIHQSGALDPLLVGFRQSAEPSSRSAAIGIRCARSFR